MDKPFESTLFRCFLHGTQIKKLCGAGYAPFTKSYLLFRFFFGIKFNIHIDFSKIGGIIILLGFIQ